MNDKIKTKRVGVRRTEPNQTKPIKTTNRLPRFVMFLMHRNSPYLNFRNINVGIVVPSLDRAPCFAGIVVVDVDGDAQRIVVGTTNLEIFFFVLDHDPRAIGVIRNLWKFVVVVSLVFLDLHVVL
jgi:hypothetical protein